MTTSEQGAPQPDRRQRLRIGVIAFRVTMVLIVPVLMLEVFFSLATRTQLFEGVPALSGFRDPWLYGSYSGDNEYWEMRFLQRPPEQRKDNPDYDPVLGWNSDSTPSLSERIGRWPHSADRPSLLLVGDSYARAVQPETWYDFEMMAGLRGLSGEFDFINKGVGGYGFDQICMMGKRELNKRSSPTRQDGGGRNVLLVSLLLDDDLDRSILKFRDWPKPHFEVDSNGRLAHSYDIVPRVDEYFDGDESIGPPFMPWMAKKLARKLSGEDHREYLTEEKKKLNTTLVNEIVMDARDHGWDIMFVLFLHSSSMEDRAKLSWRIELMETALEDLGVPWVDVGPAFDQHMTLSGLELDEYHLPADHPSAGHYNSLGNAVAFEAVLEGLRQYLGRGPGGNLYVVQSVSSCSRSDGPSTVTDNTSPRWLAYDKRYSEMGWQPPYIWCESDDSGEVCLQFLGETTPGTITARAGVIMDTQERLSLVTVVNGEETGSSQLYGSSTIEFSAALEPGDKLELKCTSNTQSPRPTIEFVLSDVAYRPSAILAPSL